jgi:hypothetical protein
MLRHVECSYDASRSLLDHEEERVRESMDDCAPGWIVNDREAQRALFNSYEAARDLVHESAA